MLSLSLSLVEVQDSLKFEQNNVGVLSLSLSRVGVPDSLKFEQNNVGALSLSLSRVGVPDSLKFEQNNVGVLSLSLSRVGVPDSLKFEQNNVKYCDLLVSFLTNWFQFLTRYKLILFRSCHKPTDNQSIMVDTVGERTFDACWLLASSACLRNFKSIYYF